LLDTDTKRRIDTARDILVGKVPDPKSQVEQITIALIYKFMDDMDAESEELGGKRKFFTGEFARYGWAKLMSPGLGGHEMLGLYAEGITKMPENPGIPPLFRDIFKNAYLPYRDPETLKSFLKIIDEFTYDHSERLGDAFEYLLSVLGSQGDAGQFRTPRHIIDFIVEIVDPRKNESILDPACGTAGFLISSYKHILRANTDTKGNATLTPDERGRLAANLKGYDISPDMVRLSLVNLYLHGFTDPHIYEYDTLTSEDRWNEFADVILANPPFMSPKGGIKPHHRFSIQAKRSEVLFVDYMAEHLRPAGRAGIIVPEGVIFQNQNAYTQLRKLLVEDLLVAVVSLPAGVFNPYSGVKTSILILDKSLAKLSDTIAFFAVERDGYGLGAQRRPLCADHKDNPALCPRHSDLPQACAEIAEYLRRLHAHQSLEDFKPMIGLIVPKARISANGDYNLSGERYREGATNAGLKWPLVQIGELCVVERGASPRPIHDFMTDAPDGVNWIKIGDAEVGAKYITSTKERVTPEGAAKSRRVKPGDFILSNSMSFGRPYVMAIDGYIHDGWLLLRDQSDRLDQDFLYNILGSKPVVAQFERSATGGVVNNLNSEIVRGVQIPLPPLEVQKEIVAEIEGYQKVINGARAVLDNYRPHIPIHPDWPVVELDEITKPEYGFTEKAAEQGDARFIRITDISEDGTLREEDPKFITLTKEARESLLSNGDILVARTGATYGKTMIFEEDYPAVFASFLIRLRFPKDRVHPRYYWIFAQSDLYWNQANALMTGGGQPQFNGNALKQVKIPLPPLATQQAIVAEIEAEQGLVAANRELIARFEQKIQATLARVWGEEETAAPEA
jgi:type I restriction enzyme M protein